MDTVNYFETPIENESKDHHPINHEKHQRHFELRRSILNQDSFVSDHSQNIPVKEVFDVDLYNKLYEGFDTISPLIYLSKDQKKFLLQKIRLFKYLEKTLLYCASKLPNQDNFDNHDCYVLVEGEVQFFNEENVFLDFSNELFAFGYDGPIFNRRLNSVFVGKNSVLGCINQKDFLEIIQPFSQFATFISRNIRYKDKIFENLTKFKNHILDSVNKGPINIGLLTKTYKKINSSLHPHANSNNIIDWSAWSYSLNRLPVDVFETFTFILMNKSPAILYTNEELSKQLIPKVIIPARNRDCYKYLNGKSLIILREMETDLLDFVCNMCIHIIESEKLRKHVLSPKNIESFFNAKESVDQTIDIIEKLIGKKIEENDRHIIKSTFKDKLYDKIIRMTLQYQDYTISATKSTVIDKDPVEKWIQNLWEISKKLLGVESSLDEIDDLVVDIIQGSKKTLINSLSPHIYKNKDEILKWASDNKIKTKTQHFLCENDRLLAFANYYYEAFPEKNIEKEKMELEQGFFYVNRTFSTGVKAILINTNKLNKEFRDSSFEIKPASKNHLILHIGYTFGAQSYHITKPLLMLFGSKARSLNIIGKAGGLVGNRTEILVADRIISDKNNELAKLNYGKLIKADLEKEANTKIHIGPMLTVSGTILQNSDLLGFYKHVMGCVGLEMEGYYFAKEVELCWKQGILRRDFNTRCFYYISDLPLDPTQNLSKEEGNISWDEGVGSMNAIQRFILKQIFS